MILLSRILFSKFYSSIMRHKIQKYRILDVITTCLITSIYKEGINKPNVYYGEGYLYRH